MNRICPFLQISAEYMEKFVVETKQWRPFESVMRVSLSNLRYGYDARMNGTGLCK